MCSPANSGRAFDFPFFLEIQTENLLQEANLGLRHFCLGTGQESGGLARVYRIPTGSHRLACLRMGEGRECQGLEPTALGEERWWT